MKRHHGIDLLRLILMFMVVVLHVLSPGGILYGTEIYSANYYLAWTLEVLCYCAVNCYALITGYVYYGKKYKFSSLLSIWTQTIFYTVGISVAFWSVFPDSFSFGGLLDAVFPVFRRAYWYVSSYVGLFILMPLLNLAIKSISIAQARRFLFVSVISFTVLSTFLLEDPFKLESGYSTIWLAYLYLIGAFIRKFGWDVKLSKKRCLIIFFACILITAGIKFTVEQLPLSQLFDEDLSKILISYNSPTIFLAGIALFLAFLHVDPVPSACKLIERFAPAAFGVYLIHCHPYVFEFLKYRFVRLAGFSPLIMTAGVFCVAMGIYLPSLLVDHLRICMFRKLRINDAIRKISDKLDIKESVS